jgi:hypothetical protein
VIKNTIPIIPNHLIIEVGVCKDLGFNEKIQEKTEKFALLLHELQNLRG